MKKVPLIAGILTLIIIVGGVFLFSKQGSTPTSSFPPSTYEYFWGDGCPHCKNVEDFFNTWEKKDQISINKLEVWNNRQNAALMAERARVCNITPSEMGVPFLVTPEGKCLSGDTDIINLFKSL
jgi:hypothetical protein